MPSRPNQARSQTRRPGQRRFLTDLRRYHGPVPPLLESLGPRLVQLRQQTGRDLKKRGRNAANVDGGNVNSKTKKMLSAKATVGEGSGNVTIKKPQSRSVEDCLTRFLHLVSTRIMESVLRRNKKCLCGKKRQAQSKALFMRATVPSSLHLNSSINRVTR